MLDLDPWCQLWKPNGWRDYLGAGDTAQEDDLIRRYTHTGRPLGALEFVRQLEGALHRRLTPVKGGRPPKQENDTRQTTLSFHDREPQ